MNALFVFVMSECDFFSCFLNSVYYGEVPCVTGPNAASAYCPCGGDGSGDLGGTCRRNLISEMHYHLFR
jgi:hypothetical protein